jgi:hypothetical protein
MYGLLVAIENAKSVGCGIFRNLILLER